LKILKILSLQGDSALKLKQLLMPDHSAVSVLKDSDSELERKEYISLMEKCTNELDDVLKKPTAALTS
jgi:hypothetical protein